MNIGNEIIRLTKNQESLIRDELSKFTNEITSIKDLTDEEKKSMGQRIEAKIEAGKKLTSKELSYLQKYNPVLYVKVTAIQKKMDGLKEQLKQCDSKQEAESLYNDQLGMITKEDPDYRMKVAYMQELMKEFRKSGHYQNLPNEAEDKEIGQEVQDIVYAGKLGSYQEAYNTTEDAMPRKSFDSVS